MNHTTGTNDRRPRTSVTAGASICLAALLMCGLAAAQVPVDDNGTPISMDTSPLGSVDVENPRVASNDEFSPADLETLVGPIALYPDDLLAVVLPASTYPLEVVQAARFLEQRAADPSLEPDEAWDDSIVALLNYPEVLKLMNDDLDWTWQLGDAVVRQQNDVVLAIETFRDRAFAAGNLESDDYQMISRGDSGAIEIEPVSDDVIYVPYYEPERVVYESPTPVYRYYPRSYPVYYYPYPSSYRFGRAAFYGVTTASTIGWATNHLHVYHHSYSGHPYYGWNYGYYGNYWRRPSINVYNTWYVNRQSPHYRYRHYRGDYWRPRQHRSGARPTTRVVSQRYNNGSRYRSREGIRANGGRTASEIRFRNRAGNRSMDSRRRQETVSQRSGRNPVNGRSRQSLGGSRRDSMPGRVATRRTEPRDSDLNRVRARAGSTANRAARAAPGRRSGNNAATTSRRQAGSTIARRGAGGDRGVAGRAGRDRATISGGSRRIAATNNASRRAARQASPRAARSAPRASRVSAGSRRNRPSAAPSSRRSAASLSGRRSAGGSPRRAGNRARGRPRGRN